MSYKAKLEITTLKENFFGELETDEKIDFEFNGHKFINLNTKQFSAQQLTAIAMVARAIEEFVFLFEN